MSGRVAFTPPDAQGIARLTLANTDKLNALSVAMWRELRRHVALLNAKPDATRVVIVAGEGGHFASGGDIEEFPQFRFDAASLARFHEEDVRPALVALLDCELPLVAQIEGACMGAGLEIASCCDIRLAGSACRFGAPIAKLGFPMAPREAALVRGAVGDVLARDMLFCAGVHSAERLYEAGFLLRVLPDGDVAGEALTSAQRILELAPSAARANKRSFAALQAAQVPPGLLADAYRYAGVAEHREGIAAFLEKRVPNF